MLYELGERWTLSPPNSWKNPFYFLELMSSQVVCGLRMCSCGMHLFSWWGHMGPPPCPEPTADLLQGLSVALERSAMDESPCP